MNNNLTAQAQVSVLRGGNSGLAPGLIGTEQVWRAVNCSIRGGRLRSRSKWVRRKTVYAGLPQGGDFFDFSGELVLSIGGNIIIVNPTDWSMRLLTNEVTRNASTNPFAWMCEVEGAIVVQDGRSWAFVYDGSDLTRYDHDLGYTLPIGTAMAYGNGRLAVVLPGGRELVIGDIHDQPLSELAFIESGYLSGGGRLSWPQIITALAHMPVADTSTGKGPLLVGFRRSMWSVRTDVTQRDSWPDISGFVTEVFNRTGITGPFAHSQVNQDIYFRSLDGIRSMRQTVADYSTAGSTPISREVSYRVDLDTKWMLDGCSAATFDNRLFVTHSPKLLNNIRPVHQGVVALNFDLISEMGAKTQPAFDGEWDGPDIVKLIEADVDDEPRLFALCREGTANSIWEFLPERTWKVDLKGGVFAEQNPVQLVESRVYYGPDPRLMKTLQNIELYFDEIEGLVIFTVRFRAEGATDWTDLETFRFESDDPVFLTDGARESRGPIRTKSPTDTIDPKRDRSVNQGNGFQFQFEWCGMCSLRIWNVEMRPIHEPLTQENEGEASDLSGESCATVLPPAPESPAFLPSLAVFNEDGSEFIGDTLTFEVGDVIVGETEVVILQLINAGGGILEIGTITPPDNWEVTAGPTLTSIAPGDISYLTLTFTAPGDGGGED